jgi:tetratricopeptide (TPR) repeat protein
MSARKSALLLLALALGLAAIWHLQVRIDAQRAALHQERDDLLFSSPRLLKAMSMEYAPLLADIYWTRAVQYYGQKHAEHQRNLDSLWPLLNITTTLDPHLLPAYRFGAMFLSEKAPDGAGRPDLAVQLIERGIHENPEYWRFYEDLGFIYYIDVKDYAKASQSFAEGSKNPRAAIWMKIMAAKIAAEGESLETSAFLWTDIYQNSNDAQMKKNALDHLQLLRARKDCQQIDVLGDEFAKRVGRRPISMRELLESGLLRRAPVDPLGFPYDIGDDGRAQLNIDSPLLERQELFDKFK